MRKTQICLENVINTLKELVLKNIFKKQFMNFFFFDFPLRWYKIFGSINKYQGPISDISPEFEFPLSFILRSQYPWQQNQNPIKTSNPISKPPHFHTDTKRERESHSNGFRSHQCLSLPRTPLSAKEFGAQILKAPTFVPQVIGASNSFPFPVVSRRPKQT